MFMAHSGQMAVFLASVQRNQFDGELPGGVYAIDMLSTLTEHMYADQTLDLRFGWARPFWLSMLNTTNVSKLAGAVDSQRCARVIGSRLLGMNESTAL